MRQRILLVFVLILGFFLSNAQVLIDDFNRANSAVVGNGWTEIELSGSGSGDSIVGNSLSLNSRNSNAANGNTFVYKNLSSNYLTTFSANPRLMTWAFNMRQSVGDPTGFNSGNFGSAVVLGSSTSDFANSGSGYAVVLGQSGADYIRLVSFSGGLKFNANLNTLISSPTAFTTENLSVKVTFTPSTSQWRLYYRNDGASFQNPSTGSLTLVGYTAVNTTYTNISLPYMGAYLNFWAALNKTATFDNFYCPNNLIPPGCANKISPANGTTNQCYSPAALTWTAGAINDGIDGYRVYFGTDGGGITTPTNLINGIDNGMTTTYNLPVLSQNTIYYWQIIPYNHGGSPVGCTVFSFTTGVDPAVGIASYSGDINTCTGATSSNLSLSSYSGILQWQYDNLGTWTNIGASNTNPLSVSPAATTTYRALVNGACAQQVISNSVTVKVNQTYIVTAASPFYEPFTSTPSCWTVLPVSGTGNWTFVNSYAQYSGGMGDTASIISPVLDISSATMTKPWMSLQWKGGSKLYADRVNVYVSTDGGNTWGAPFYTVNYAYPGQSNIWNTEGMIDLSSFTGQSNLRVKLEAINPSGVNLLVDNFYVMNMGCANVSLPLNASNITPTTATVSWPVIAADSFLVRYRMHNSAAWLYSSFTTSNSISLIKLVPEATFDYEVASWCGSVSAGFNAAGSFTNTTGSAPANLTVSGISAGKATLRWDYVSGALRYWVLLSTDGGSTWPIQQQTTSNFRAFTTLQSATTYSWRIVPVFGFGYDIAMYPADGLGFVTSGCAATGLTANIISGTKANLTWAAVPGATKYTIRISNNGGASWLSTAEITTTSRTYSTLTINTSYTWEVNSFCDGAYRGYVSGPGFVTPAARMAINTTVSSDPEVAIYPNPFNSATVLHVPDSLLGAGTYKVIDMNGSTVESGILTETETHIGLTLKTGLYLLQIYHPQYFKSFKMIKAD